MQVSSVDYKVHQVHSDSLLSVNVKDSKQGEGAIGNFKMLRIFGFV